MRFEFGDEPGWKTLRKCAHAGQLHALLEANMAALAPLDMAACAVHSACFEDACARQTLHIIKCPHALAGGSVEIHQIVWECLPATCNDAEECVWRHVRAPGDDLWYRQGAPMPMCATGRGAGLSALLARAPLDPMPVVAAGGVGAHTKGVGAHMWRGVEIIVRLSVRVCRVVFSSDSSVKALHLYTPARCVNACYTTCIRGLVDLEHQLKTINARGKRGPCGSELYISSVFGVFQIFPSTNGARRVTCKAFTDIAQAEFALLLACSGLGVSVAGPLNVHMIVMHGNTGRQLDISPRGNLVHCIQRKFNNVTYTEKLDEVNVHALFKWHDIAAACAACPPQLQQRMANKFVLLQRVELTVSVTRLGTCIYRVGVKKAPAAPVGPAVAGFADPPTADVEQCLFALCVYIHEFLTLEA